MKVKEILELKVEEFRKLLTEDEINYIEGKYISVDNFLGMYQDGAKLNDEDEYVDIHEYIKLMQDSDLWSDM